MNTQKPFLYAIIGLLLCSVINASAALSLPFFDNFEEEDGTGLIYWDTENLEGWQYWHVIAWAGNSGRCMRFEVCDLDQNDWLITKALDCSGAEKIAINFDFLYSGSGNLPALYYTAAYNGNAAQSTWTELNYTPGPEQHQWHSVDEISIDSPGDRLYLAFHYQAAANQGVYCLLDNVSVKEYRAPSTLVGSSDHFEFYTNLQDQEEYYLDLVDELEYKYQMYQSLWERPSSNTVFPELDKIKLIYEAQNPASNAGDSSFACDAGSFDFQQGTIILHPLDTDKKVNYYGTLAKLAVNELAQMALYGWMDASSERWFSEGFGLYEMGYRPDRQALLQKLSELGSNEPSLSVLQNIGDLSLPGNKDLMASFFQSKVLIQCYFFGFYGNDTYKWRQLLKHYYSKETDRIELLYSSANFDFYAAAKERPYIGAMAINMEDQLALQSTRFGPLMKHRFSICLYDAEVGKEINDRTDFQGLACGADKINSLPLDSGDYGLINHEFMHCWVNRMSPIVQLSATSFMPGQFLNEGLAESTDGFMSDEEMTWHRYKIDDLFYHYQRKYGREPEWLEIVDNAEVNKEDGFWVDAYALGEMYWRYMYDKYPDDFWTKVRLFLRNGRDWTVFGGKSSEQEGAEFIQFMKELAFVGPPKKTSSIPFFENFGSDFTGWTRMRFGSNNHWQLQDHFGYDDSHCAFADNPYWFDEEEDKNTDSWLVSPPLDASGPDSVRLEFMYRQTGLADKPEIYYTGDFSGPTDSTSWIALEGLDWNAPEAEWDIMQAQIDCPPDTLYIALRFKSGEGEAYSYAIDNFKVEGLLNSLPGNSITQHRFEVYPNPVNTATMATFVTTGAGRVQLRLYDLQGRMVMTVFDREFHEGKHTIPLGKQLLAMKTNALSKGLYFCRLSTKKGTSTIKIVIQ